VKPAARSGDMTSHGSPLGPAGGSIDVLIEGMPAWRVGSDIHSCPLSDGPKPHVGGIVSVGSTTVLINNCPAARVGDIITEAGSPNTITLGAKYVFIGG
jgi:uncharacterized Zn-binding protein involved in type VI secretion